MKKINIITVSLISILILFSTSGCTAMNTQNKYGEKVQYTQGQSLIFPDFKVSFVGERKVEVPQYVHGFFQYYDFEVFSNSEKITISWSSGTGDIAPTIFKFNGKDFLLEKGTSDILGNLEENEIVIWSKDKYDSEIQKH